MFQDKRSTTKNKINAELQELTGLKWSFGLTVDFFKDDKKIKGTFYSNQYATLSADEIDSFFGEATLAIVQKIEKFTKEGSGWINVIHCFLTSQNMSHSRDHHIFHSLRSWLIKRQ